MNSNEYSTKWNKRRLIEVRSIGVRLAAVNRASSSAYVSRAEMRGYHFFLSGSVQKVKKISVSVSKINKDEASVGQITWNVIQWA